MFAENKSYYRFEFRIIQALYVPSSVTIKPNKFVLVLSNRKFQVFIITTIMVSETVKSKNQHNLSLNLDLIICVLSLSIITRAKPNTFNTRQTWMFAQYLNPPRSIYLMFTSVVNPKQSLYLTDAIKLITSRKVMTFMEKFSIYKKMIC